MKTVIIGNGEICDYSFCKKILRSADKIVCADGGTRHAINMEIIPDVIIGDMDSSSKLHVDHFRKAGVEIIRYPKDKDKTDMHICMEYALAFSKEIILLGATGNRIDHLMANISLLKLGLESDILISIRDNKNCIRMIKDSIVLEGEKGDFFSLIPFSEKVEGIKVKGAHYELDDASMEFGNPYGISNYFKDSRVLVSIRNGYLLVIKSED